MREGTVVITGKSNVGKSTLMNAIAKREISIVSHKSQTTRSQINCIVKINGSQIAFIDTPGFHIPHNDFGIYMNSKIKNAYKYADIALFVYDLSKKFDSLDLQVLKLISSFNIKKTILVLNKMDLINKVNHNIVEKEIEKYIKLVKTIQISALKNKNIDLLLNSISDSIANNPICVNETNSDAFIISEIVRKQIIFNLRQELPYSSCVVLRGIKYSENKKKLETYLDIIVERESQKPIVIGKNGVMIKKIGTIARKELEKYYNCKVMLKLFVIVSKNWRSNKKLIKEHGYY